MLVFCVGLTAVLLVAILSRDHDIAASQETVVTAEIHLGEAAIAALPDRVHLSRRALGEFSYYDRSQAAREGLASEGFADAGAYRIDELPGVHVLLMTQARERMTAAVYDDERLGVWVEVVSRFTDGRRWTHTTLAGGGLETRERNALVSLPGASLAELLARARADRPGGDLEPVERHAAAPGFERDYAAWIAERKRALGVELETEDDERQLARAA